MSSHLFNQSNKPASSPFGQIHSSSSFLMTSLLPILGSMSVINALGLRCIYFTAKATRCMQPCDQRCLREQSQVDIHCLHCLECRRQSRVSNGLLFYFAISILVYILMKNKQHKENNTMTRPFSSSTQSFTILSLDITS